MSKLEEYSLMTESLIDFWFTNSILYSYLFPLTYPFDISKNTDKKFYRAWPLPLGYILSLH